MERFGVRREAKQPERIKEKSKLALAAALGVLIAGGLIASCIVTRPVTATITKDEVIETIDSCFRDIMGLTMQHDVMISLSNENGQISFIADGYNPEIKILYEWIGADDYYTFLPETTLDEREISQISNSRLGDYYILTLRTPGNYTYESFGDTADNSNLIYQVGSEFAVFESVFSNRGLIETKAGFVARMNELFEDELSILSYSNDAGVVLTNIHSGITDTLSFEADFRNAAGDICYESTYFMDYGDDLYILSSNVITNELFGFWFWLDDSCVNNYRFGENWVCFFDAKYTWVLTNEFYKFLAVYTN